MARLTFTRPSDASPLFAAPLRAGVTRIGRADTCDVVLPDEGVSRLHCLMTEGKDGWSVTNVSRNGTWLRGEAVVEARALHHGDELRVGPFLVRLDLETGPDDATTERAQPEARDEELLEAHEGIAVREPWLVITRGPGRGQRVRLRGGRCAVGGDGSAFTLPDPRLVRDHCRLRLLQGRTVVEPGEGAVFLGPTRIRDIVPLYPGEELRAGDTEFAVEWTDRVAGRAEVRADAFGELVGISETLCTAFGVLRRMAAHHAPILLIGESGTGKELAARGIHDASPRAARAFVALNCGAITPSLFESELFGHEKGAFTGAGERRDGAFQRANGGTLFLDEVGELPEEAQAKLLRALESGEVRRVGGATASFPDVRIVAATNRNLAESVRAGTFRADLYFRLAVLAVRLPPLRERTEDIPLIARTLARRLHPAIEIAPDALHALQRWPWPGNARELRNVLTRAWVLGGTTRLEARHLVFSPLEEGAPVSVAAPSARPSGAPFRPDDAAGPVRNAIDAAERDLVEQALRRSGGNRTHAARELGIPRSSLLYKLQRWGIEA
jgi:DNA-binding NtrC family response regulator